MLIGQRLRDLRESKNLSQGDIERRTGLLRCCLSRVENGHTVPSVETLEKMARALEVSLYQLFHDGESPVQKLHLSAGKNGDSLWGANPNERRELRQFAKALSKMTLRNRNLLMQMAHTFAKSAHQSGDGRGSEGR